MKVRAKKLASCTSAAFSATSSIGSWPRKTKTRTPAAVLLWAFSNMSQRRLKKGLTTQAVVKFVKQSYVPIGGISPGRAIGKALKRGIEFGLIEKRGNRHFLARELN